MDGWMDGLMNVFIDWVDGWIDRADKWMNGLGGWLNGQIWWMMVYLLEEVVLVL